MSWWGWPLLVAESWLGSASSSSLGRGISLPDALADRIALEQHLAVSLYGTWGVRTRSCLCSLGRRQWSWVSEELCQLTDVEQELAELGETFRAELLCPGGLDLGNGFADHVDRGIAACSECDAF